MSKPDPKITANLLDTLGAKPAPEHREEMPTRPIHGEGHSGAPKLRPARVKMAQGRTRTSNRGK